MTSVCYSVLRRTGSYVHDARHGLLRQPLVLIALIGCIGSVLWLFLCVFVIWLYRRRRNNRKLLAGGRKTGGRSDNIEKLRKQRRSCLVTMTEGNNSYGRWWMRSTNNYLHSRIYLDFIARFFIDQSQLIVHNGRYNNVFFFKTNECYRFRLFVNRRNHTLGWRCRW